MNEEAAIDQILSFPGIFTAAVTSLISVSTVFGGQLPVKAQTLGADDDRGDFYESSFDLQSGLQVTERKVPAELFAAVFTGRHHYPVRR